MKLLFHQYLSIAGLFKNQQILIILLLMVIFLIVNNIKLIIIFSTKEYVWAF